MGRARLGYLVACMLVLSSTVAVAIARYPEQAIVPCEDQAPGEVPGCIQVFYTNFGTKAWLIGFGVALATILFAAAFRRRLDLRRYVAATF